MNGSDPHPQVVLSPKEHIPQIHNQAQHDSNQHRPSKSPETSTSASTHSAHGDPEQFSPTDRDNLLRHIRSLETHNGKLYEDNCQLVNAVNMLNDRLAFAGASRNTQVLHLAEMQEKLRASEMNRALLNGKYQELLHGISVNSAHHHLAMELTATRNAYTALDQTHRVLRDKYTRLKAVFHTTQQQLRDPGPTPGFYPLLPNGVSLHPDQHRINAISPPSAVPPTSMTHPMAHHQDHRRQNSESVIAQPPDRPVRVGVGPITTTWLRPLPTPSVTAPVNATQMLPTINPPMSTGPHPLPRQDPPTHVQRSHGTRTMSGPPILTNHPTQQSDVIKLPKFALNAEQRRGGVDTNVASIPKSTTPQSLKRPNSDLPDSAGPEGDKKRPRIEEEQTQADKPTVKDSEIGPTVVQSPSPTTGDQGGDKPVSPSSDNDIRSYEDCVNLIFEKDADIENGVFCGLCLDRYDAKMIPEPPDVLVQPDFDLLVRHCMTMHPAVWEGLRHRRT